MPRDRRGRFHAVRQIVAVVVCVLAVPYFLGKDHPLYICSLCPAGALEGALPFAAQSLIGGHGMVWPGITKIVITVLIVIAMFFTLRPWCRLFCPLGAIYSLFNRFSLVAVRYTPDTCTECGLCHKPCKYGVLPVNMGKAARCIRCMDCAQCGGITLGNVPGMDYETDGLTEVLIRLLRA